VIQGFQMEALMARFDLTDAKWTIIAPLLPGAEGYCDHLIYLLTIHIGFPVTNTSRRKRTAFNQTTSWRFQSVRNYNRGSFPRAASTSRVARYG